MDKKDLKIVFFGTPEFAVESLRRLTDGGFNIAAVVTMPDKPAGRGHKLFQSPVKEFALKHNMRILQPTNLKDNAFLEELRSLDANLFIVIAFRMLPATVWQMPALGTFNLHASLLPRYRGAAPINWAIINGDTKTGVTTFFLKHEIDTGDVISQESIEILPEDDAGSVHDKLMTLGAELTMKTVEDILNDNVKTIPQSEMSGGIDPTAAPKIFRETCHIDWNRSAEEIHNLVRGLSPYPSAWTDILFSDGIKVNVKILKTTLSERKTSEAGKLTIENGRLFAGCKDGSVEIVTLRPEGKRVMAASDYLRGLRSEPVSAI